MGLPKPLSLFLQKICLDWTRTTQLDDVDRLLQLLSKVCVEADEDVIQLRIADLQ